MTEHIWPSVTVIIPNFNGAHLLRTNLPYVLKAAEDYPGECPVIVVDDGSRDDSVAAVRSEFPSVRLIEHKANRGFADAVHSGVEAAASELLIFLNSDVRPYAGFITPLIRHFDEPDIFSVSPLIMDESGDFNPVSWRCFRIKRGRLRPIPWYFGGTNRGARASLFASGGSVMLRKSMFLALGGFLPIFKPFYSEDVDLGLRAWRRRWRTLFESESRVIHGQTGSIQENVASRHIRKTRERNRFLLEWIHVPSRDLILNLIPGYLLQSAGRLLKFDLVYFQALYAALRRLPEARRFRAEVEQSDALGFWDIMDTIKHDFER